MKKTIFSSCVLILLLVFSCKKKETTTEEPPATNSTTGTTTTTGGGAYSDMQTTYIVTDLLGTISRDSAIYANFYSSPVTSSSLSLVNAGAVTLNSISIPTLGLKYGIIFNSPVNLLSSLNWSVTGSGTITAFSHSFTPSYPKYSGGNLLPDTCSKLAGITLTISGVTNNIGNVVIVQLFGGSANSVKYILTSNGTISFTSQELASFPTNTNLSIQLGFANFTYATYSGIKHGFSNNLQYIKYAYLKP
ncbi:MAG: hypothetical protein JNJ41_15155 [Bacteroidia bacterium]|nr:hypothetical protein [Bacteroidia bacterium]